MIVNEIAKFEKPRPAAVELLLVAQLSKLLLVPIESLVRHRCPPSRRSPFAPSAERPGASHLLRATVSPCLSEWTTSTWGTPAPSDAGRASALGPISVRARRSPPATTRARGVAVSRARRPPRVRWSCWAADREHRAGARRSARPRARRARPGRRGACAGARATSAPRDPLRLRRLRRRSRRPTAAAEDGARPRDRAARRGGGPTGPLAPALAAPRRIAPSASLRTSTWSRSPASMRVEPRGGIACSPRTITLTSASRGRPSSRTRSPTSASPAPTGELDHLGAEPADRAGLGERRAAAPARSSSRRAAARPARTSCPGASSTAAPRRRRC